MPTTRRDRKRALEAGREAQPLEVLTDHRLKIIKPGSKRKVTTSKASSSLGKKAMLLSAQKKAEADDQRAHSEDPHAAEPLITDTPSVMDKNNDNESTGNVTEKPHEDPVSEPVCEVPKTEIQSQNTASVTSGPDMQPYTAQSDHQVKSESSNTPRGSVVDIQDNGSEYSTGIRQHLADCVHPCEKRSDHVCDFSDLTTRRAASPIILTRGQKRTLPYPVLQVLGGVGIPIKQAPADIAELLVLAELLSQNGEYTGLVEMVNDEYCGVEEDPTIRNLHAPTVKQHWVAVMNHFEVTEGTRKWVPALEMNKDQNSLTDRNFGPALVRFFLHLKKFSRKPSFSRPLAELADSPWLKELSSEDVKKASGGELMTGFPPEFERKFDRDHDSAADLADREQSAPGWNSSGSEPETIPQKFISKIDKLNTAGYVPSDINSYDVNQPRLAYPEPMNKRQWQGKMSNWEKKEIPCGLPSESDRPVPESLPRQLSPISGFDDIHTPIPLVEAHDTNNELFGEDSSPSEESFDYGPDANEEPDVPIRHSVQDCSLAEFSAPNEKAALEEKPKPASDEYTPHPRRESVMSIRSQQKAPFHGQTEHDISETNLAADSAAHIDSGVKVTIHQEASVPQVPNYPVAEPRNEYPGWRDNDESTYSEADTLDDNDAWNALRNSNDAFLSR